MYDVDTLLDEPLLLEPLRRSVREGAPPAFLRSAKIKLTARCNLKCVMCRYGKGWSPEEMSGERMLEVLGELAGLGCRKVHLSGGEVLVRRDLEGVVERAVAEGMKVTLTSNLTLLDKARARALVKARVRAISTSLDGASAETHDRVRGIPGSFERTLAALALLRQERERRGRKLALRLNFTLMRSNYREYPELVRLAAREGAVNVEPMPVDTKVEELRLGRARMDHYNQEIAPRVLEERTRAGMPITERYVYPFGRTETHLKASKRGHYAGGHYKDHPCYAPFTHLFIAWDGQVYLCCMTNGRIESLGDVSRQSVGQVFLGERFEAIRRRILVERPKPCHRCDMFLEANRQLEEPLRGVEPRGQLVGLAHAQRAPGL